MLTVILAIIDSKKQIEAKPIGQTNAVSLPEG